MLLILTVDQVFNSQQEINIYLNEIFSQTKYGYFDDTSISAISQIILQEYNDKSTFLNEFQSFRVNCISKNTRKERFMNKFYFTKETVDLTTCSFPTSEQFPDHNFHDYQEMVIWDYIETSYSWPHYSGDSKLINNQIKKYLFTNNFTIFLQDGVSFLNQFVFSIHPNSYLKIYDVNTMILLFDDLSGNYDPQITKDFNQLDTFPNFDSIIEHINSLKHQQILVLARGFYWKTQLNSTLNITIINTFVENFNQNSWLYNSYATKLDDIILSRTQMNNFATSFKIPILFLYSNKVNQKSQIKQIIEQYLNIYVTNDTVLTFPIRTNKVLDQLYINFIVKPIFNKQNQYIGFISVSFNFDKILMKIIPNYNYLVTSDLLILKRDYLIHSLASVQEYALSFKEQNYVFNDSFFESQQLVMNTTSSNQLRFEYKIQQQTINTSQIYVYNNSMQSLILGQQKKFINVNKQFISLDFQGYQYPKYHKEGSFYFKNVTMVNDIKLVIIIPEIQFTDHNLMYDKNIILTYPQVLKEFKCLLFQFKENCQNEIAQVLIEIPYQLIKITNKQDQQIDIIFETTFNINCSVKELIFEISGPYKCITDDIQYEFSENIRFELLSHAISHYIQILDKKEYSALLYHKNIAIHTSNQSQIIGFAHFKKMNFYKSRIISYIPIVYKEQRRNTKFDYCKTQPLSLYMYQQQLPFLMIISPEVAQYYISSHNTTDIMVAFNGFSKNGTLSLFYQTNRYNNEHNNVYNQPENNFLIIDNFAQIIYSPLQLNTNLTYRFRNKNFFENDLCQHSQLSMELVKLLFLNNALEYSVFISSQQYCLIFKVIQENIDTSYMKPLKNSNLYNVSMDWEKFLPLLNISNIPCFTSLEFANEFISSNFDYPQKYYQEKQQVIQLQDRKINQQQNGKLFYSIYVIIFIILSIVAVLVVYCH